MTIQIRRRHFVLVLGFLGLVMILIRSSKTSHQPSHFIPKQTELYLTPEHVNGTCYDLFSRIWSSPKAAMWPNNPHEPASSPPPPSRPLTHLVAFIQQHSYMNHNHSSSSPSPSNSGITQAVCKFRNWVRDGWTTTSCGNKLHDVLRIGKPCQKKNTKPSFGYPHPLLLVRLPHCRQGFGPYHDSCKPSLGFKSWCVNMDRLPSDHQFMFNDSQHQTMYK